MSCVDNIVYILLWYFFRQISKYLKSTSEEKKQQLNHNAPIRIDGHNG